MNGKRLHNWQDVVALGMELSIADPGRPLSSLELARLPVDPHARRVLLLLLLSPEQRLMASYAAIGDLARQGGDSRLLSRVQAMVPGHVLDLEFVPLGGRSPALACVREAQELLRGMDHDQLDDELAHVAVHVLAMAREHAGIQVDDQLARLARILDGDLVLAGEAIYGLLLATGALAELRGRELWTHPPSGRYLVADHFSLARAADILKRELQPGAAADFYRRRIGDLDLVPICG